LRDQVEERLKFYQTGEAPRRNLDVMEEVKRELNAGKGGDGDKKPAAKIDDDDDDVDMDDTKDKKKKSKKDKKEKKKRKGEEVMWEIDGKR
jgi:nucleolar protein 56